MDAERNDISDVRHEGVPLPAAAARLAWLLGQARSHRLSGVEFKDEAPMIATNGTKIRPLTASR